MRQFFLFTMLMASLTIHAKTLYVTINGNDSNDGLSKDQAFYSISTAVSNIIAGDSILVGGGIYYYSTTITLSLDGSESDSCYLMACVGEKPVLDFSAQDFGDRALSLTGSYWYIKGFDVRYAGDNGMIISGGNNNVVEQCNFYENQDTGLQIGNGAHDNTILNCDSYFNADPSDYGDADGFAAKLDVGTNNKFVGCRAWQNCDDGWDGYLRGADDVTTILENCWTWRNGYMKDGSDPGSQANGNGFKMGGGDNSNADELKHHFILTNCMSFYNKAKGFDQNNNVGTMEMYNCTGYGNETSNYRFQKDLVAGESLILKNCVSLNGKVELADFAEEATNGWSDGFTTTAADFVSVDTTGISGARKSDGSLPDVAFMHLVEGSNLIDAGTDVDLVYYGAAPDLGAFESNYTDPVSDTTDTIPDTDTTSNTDTTTNSIAVSLIGNVDMWFSGNDLQLRFADNMVQSIELHIYTITGQQLLNISVSSNENSINCSGLDKGIYIVELISQNSQTVQKLNKGF